MSDQRAEVLCERCSIDMDQNVYHHPDHHEPFRLSRRTWAWLAWRRTKDAVRAWRKVATR